MLWSVPDWSVLQWSVLISGGVICGFINTLAGGGSFITLPLLIFLGQPPLIANATNRFALVIQTGTAATGFWYAGERDTQTVLWLAGPGLLGSFLGAHLAVHLDPQVFRTLFALLLVLAVVPVLYKPKIFENPKHTDASEATQRPPIPLLWAFLFVGMYSGFLQVGVGVWSLILLLNFGAMHVNRANAIKSQLLFLTTGSATILFFIYDQVVLSVGLLLAIGNATGAWLATRLVREKNVSWLRWLVLGGSLAACLRLLNIV